MPQKVGMVDTKVAEYRIPVYNILKSRGIDIVLTAKNRIKDLPYTLLPPKPLPFFSMGWCPGLWNHLSRNNYDILIACDVAQSSTWQTYLYCKRHRKKFILWGETWQWSKSLKAQLAVPMVRKIIRGADAHISAGQKAKKFLVNQGVNPDKIFIAPNSAEDLSNNVSPAYVDELKELVGQNKCFLYVSRIIPYKAVDIVVKAFNRMPHNCTLIIVGGDVDLKGSTEYMLKCKSESTHPNIHWIGKVPHSDIASFYAICDVFMLVSRFRPYDINPSEAWGMVVNEAMSLGKPIIVSDAVGASDDAVDKTNGLVVTAGDVDSLYDAMTRILKMDLVAMGRASRVKIDNYLNFNRMADGFFEAIDYLK